MARDSGSHWAVVKGPGAHHAEAADPRQAFLLLKLRLGALFALVLSTWTLDCLVEPARFISKMHASVNS